MKSQRRGVLVMSLVLCFWLFAFASHVHAHHDEGAHGKARTACTVCLSLPTGAPAPSLLQVSDAPAAIEPVSTRPQVCRDGEVPSSYLIRGPPAR
jgi:hypothetical protein